MQSRHYASVFRGYRTGCKTEESGPRRHGDQNYDVFSLVALSACICPDISTLRPRVNNKSYRDVTRCFLSAAAAAM